MKYVTLVATIVAALTSVRPSSAQVPNFRHVFIIVMENDEFNNIIGSPDAPYINRLASENGLATNAFAVTHPSLPNYMALTGGDTAFTTNCIGCVTPAANIADQIEASGRTWTAHMEDMPAPARQQIPTYVARHNPFVHTAMSCRMRHGATAAWFLPVQQRSLRWQLERLRLDHAEPVQRHARLFRGDRRRLARVGRAADSPVGRVRRQRVVLTFDEGTSTAGGGGQIPLVVASPWTPAGTRAGTTLTHYSLLHH
jgi:hypothetical protein